jgi:hypothetical protein
MKPGMGRAWQKNLQSFLKNSVGSHLSRNRSYALPLGAGEKDFLIFILKSNFCRSIPHRANSGTTQTDAVTLELLD